MCAVHTPKPFFSFLIFNMDVTDHWRHYYLDSAGNVKKKKKNILPKYLRRAKSFTENSTNSISSAANNSNIFRGWNRSAYFRFKANQNTNSSSNKSQSAPDSGYSGSTTKSVKSILAPLFSEKSNNKSDQNISAITNRFREIDLTKKSGASRKSKPPTDLLMNNTNTHHSITGKVVIVTPKLIVTKTSPTPTEENSPILNTKDINTDSSNLNNENDKKQVTKKQATGVSSKKFVNLYKFLENIF